MTARLTAGRRWATVRRRRRCCPSRSISILLGRAGRATSRWEGIRGRGRGQNAWAWAEAKRRVRGLLQSRELDKLLVLIDLAETRDWSTEMGNEEVVDDHPIFSRA